MPGQSGDEEYANANLIASAPDLLAALEMALAYIETGDMKPLDTRVIVHAIAKAKGES